jgi:hypothetical protein
MSVSDQAYALDLCAGASPPHRTVTIKTEFERLGYECRALENNVAIGGSPAGDILINAVFCQVQADADRGLVWVRPRATPVWHRMRSSNHRRERGESRRCVTQARHVRARW